MKNKIKPISPSGIDMPTPNTIHLRVFRLLFWRRRIFFSGGVRRQPWSEKRGRRGSGGKARVSPQAGRGGGGRGNYRTRQP
ncbi:MAG: hypothetical protein LBP75_06780 [Planctomycetota bacterium]|nr:hypothetical protein [Planctomycetota bacterium]